MNDETRHAIDALSVGLIASSIMDIVPHIAGILSLVWFALQIYGWFERRWSKRKQYKRRGTDN